VGRAHANWLQSMYVYLDTVFLSQLTKTSDGRGRKAAIKWQRLLNLLDRGVQRGILLCPGSQFQTQEVMLAKGLQDPYIALQHNLSKGYFFREWQEILVHQTASQLLSYLGRPQDIDFGWRFLTKLQPTVVSPSVTVRMKTRMSEFANLAKSLSTAGTSYNGQYETEKKSFLQNSFLEPIRRLLGLPTYSTSPDAYSPLWALLEEARVSSKDELLRALQFFDSPLVDKVPFIHIFCSVFAALRFHEPSRNYTGSEKEDAVALACAIPYCQIVTTDVNMKSNIVNRLHLDKAYGATLYSPRKGDLCALEQVLSEKMSMREDGEAAYGGLGLPY